MFQDRGELGLSIWDVEVALSRGVISRLVLIACSFFFTVTLFGGFSQGCDDMSQSEETLIDLNSFLELSVISIGLARCRNFFLPFAASQIDQSKLAGGAHSCLLFRQVLLQHREC